MPDERTLSAGLVILLTMAIAVAAAFSRGGTGPAALPAPTPAVAPAIALAPTPTPSPPPAPVAAAASPTAEPAAIEVPGLLPGNRILAFYGHPHDPNMGIVGEYAPEEVFDRLLDLAADYEAADPSRPVIPAFELIATVAQRTPGPDGTFVLVTDTRSLRRYVDYAEAHGAIVILDIQIGRGTVPAEFEKVRSLLERPNVHLAIDPEFAMEEGEIPGETIGSIDASSVRYAQEQLSEIVRANGLPPKLLIVHQFEEDMIRNKMTLGPVPGVQLVIDADGYGKPELKIAVFNFLVRDEPVGFAGLKLFFQQDKPLMTPRDVLALTPEPDVIIYQ
ncbi:MAG: hypothetical protein ACKOWF_00120 [Chloroflexota bacterium]